MRRRSEISRELKEKITRRALDGERVADLAKEIKYNQSVVYKWKREAKRGSGSGSIADGRMALWVKGERAMLLQMLGEQVLEIARLKSRK